MRASIRFFWSPDGAPPAGIRQAFGQWAYDSSQLLRFTEEAIAEGVATGSVTGDRRSHSLTDMLPSLGCSVRRRVWGSVLAA